MADRDLTKGPVWAAVARVSSPMMLGILAVLSVGVADAFFLGRLGGAPLAAIGFIYPVTTAVTSLSIGLSAGANAAISQSLGRDDGREHTTRLGLHAIGLGLGLAILVALTLWALGGPLFSLLGAEGQVADEIAAYLPWWCLSFPFLVVLMIINAIFRAHGDGGPSAVLMTLAAVLNIALDPILIFGLGPIPELGTGGAAIATLIGRILAMVLAILWALRRGLLRTCEDPLTNLRGSLAETLKVGMPAAFSNAINPAGMAAVTAAVATLGDAAVAGFGAATRVQSLGIVPLLALSAGIGPVVGQNWGADRADRARGALWASWSFCLGYGLLLAIVLTVFDDQIAALIATEGPAADYTAQYLRIVGWSLWGYGVLVVANAAMNARSKALHSTGLSIARTFAIYLPGAWLGVWIAGFGGILAAAVAANLLAVLGAAITARATGLLSTEFSPIRAPAERLQPRG